MHPPPYPPSHPASTLPPLVSSLPPLSKHDTYLNLPPPTPRPACRRTCNQSSHITHHTSVISHHTLHITHHACKRTCNQSSPPSHALDLITHTLPACCSPCMHPRARGGTRRPCRPFSHLPALPLLPALLPPSCLPSRSCLPSCLPSRLLSGLTSYSYLPSCLPSCRPSCMPALPMTPARPETVSLST